MNFVKYNMLILVIITSILKTNNTSIKNLFTYKLSSVKLTNEIRLIDKTSNTKPLYIPSNYQLLSKGNAQDFSNKKNVVESITSNDKKRFNYLLILFFVVCSILTILLMLIVVKLKNSNTQIKDLEIKEKATLQQQIKRKEEEILATVMVVSAQQKELKLALNAIENLKKEKQDPNIEKIYAKLKSIAKSSSNLNLIFQKLESQYTYFSTSIKNIHPNLTENDIRNCILIRLSFSLKDSAELLNVSVHAIKIARQRIKKKISYSSNMSLKEYLDTFENEESILYKV
ncbi:hypothetical protein [Tenacibaculum sp. M341]|uniref:hypothetical protein n=1 Tax=Tenacibaculum sp. M341 TaxID=2530339 RepID=UPI00104AC7F4|nr:hypothetical protein [Tenacibaculum sp. M341]TCI90408.1 hypothetical protein EYW44_14335 [Tenacibaculum sp. M341]